MIVGNFNVHRSVRCPSKANSELIVHSDRVLAATIIRKSFQPIARRQSKVAQIDGGVEITELAARDFDQIARKALRAFAFEDGFGGTKP
jgi:hypothetical protein